MFPITFSHCPMVTQNQPRSFDICSTVLPNTYTYIFVQIRARKLVVLHCLDQRLNLRQEMSASEMSEVPFFDFIGPLLVPFLAKKWSPFGPLRGPKSRGTIIVCTGCCRQGRKITVRVGLLRLGEMQMDNSPYVVIFKEFSIFLGPFTLIFV